MDHENFEISDEHIANARRAYCGNISYLDEQIGSILDTLDECGMRDDTVIVFTADHGDMMGERGLWYKMSFFEGSMRVPLVISAPNRFQPRSIDNPVSQLDLAPTLVELGGGDDEAQAFAVDGRSLLSVLNGTDESPQPVLGEYVGEGSIDPMLMIRMQQWKFNYCENDPPQLFDLEADPHELNNLALQAEQQELVQQFIERVCQRWNIPRFRSEVLSSQKRRHRVYQGLRQGKYQPWDHQPVQNSSDRFMRNHLDLNVLESQARFPRQKQ